MAVTARRPADSYFEVAEWLGDEWFTKPTPERGLLISVAGRDGAVSRWHLDDATAGLLIAWARHCIDIGVVKIIPYGASVTP